MQFVPTLKFLVKTSKTMTSFFKFFYSKKIIINMFFIVLINFFFVFIFSSNLASCDSPSAACKSVNLKFRPTVMPIDLPALLLKDFNFVIFLANFWLLVKIMPP